MSFLTPLHILQKKFVRLVTYNDTYPVVPGPLTHTPPLFYKLKILTIFDIYKLQLGKLVYDFLNNIGPTRSIIQFTRASEIHNYYTRYADEGNFHSNWVRTTRFGLNDLQILGGNLWETLPSNIRDSKTKNIFVRRLKLKLIHGYSIQ